ncbi:unnamed protein product, partial [Symbiodinium pilosum]
MMGIAIGGDDALLKAKRQKKEAEAAKNQDSADKADTPEDGIKKEEKDEVKDELKEEKEEKVEVKTEVKEEDEEEDEDALNEIMEADTGASSRRKRKRQEADEAVVPDMPAVETDTEYDEVDVSGFPKALRIEGCLYEKANGLYRRFSKSSRGRPAYCKASKFADRKKVFLFWVNKKWCVGFEFGARKNVAFISEVDEIDDPPFEPYPGVWKVIDKHKDKDHKESAEKEECMGMRVIDEALYDESHELEDLEQPLEAKYADEVLKRSQEKAQKKDEKKSQRAAAKASEKVSDVRTQSESAKATPK